TLCFQCVQLLARLLDVTVIRGVNGSVPAGQRAHGPEREPVGVGYEADDDLVQLYGRLVAAHVDENGVSSRVGGRHRDRRPPQIRYRSVGPPGHFLERDPVPYVRVFPRRLISAITENVELEVR